ncbi:hypothetical protein GWI33_019427 [Rhynchophorus ferrugineus]|uniref:Uncharacterized protein n=1 Tax=Rhynchophorus ferrugineus TaxID=354439 RepID=A0A834HSW5_RHYFE|nr:hypothetical protein GWI33_019427 [Rhynchophorus ferrugineus]
MGRVGLIRTVRDNVANQIQCEKHELQELSENRETTGNIDKEIGATTPRTAAVAETHSCPGGISANRYAPPPSPATHVRGPTWLGSPSAAPPLPPDTRPVALSSRPPATEFALRTLKSKYVLDRRIFSSGQTELEKKWSYISRNSSASNNNNEDVEGEGKAGHDRGDDGIFNIFAPFEISSFQRADATPAAVTFIKGFLHL